MINMLRFISYLIGVAIAGVTFGQRPLPWDGPLVPVDAGRMIVAATCTRNQPLRWSKELRDRAHGMEPGERVWLLTRDGATTLRLGKPACYAGECRGDYASLQLPTKRLDVIAAVPLRFLSSTDRVQPLILLESSDGSCVEPPTLEWMADVCRTFDVGSSNRRLQVQTERRPMQNGWDVIRTHARMITGRDNGRWQVVSTSTAVVNPEIVLFRQGSQLVLWRQIVGIGGPAEITIVISRIEVDGFLAFGRRYSAGGQPCD